MNDRSAVSSLVAGYQPQPGFYDEMCDRAGKLRPHWESLAQHLENLGSSDLQRRSEQARRQLHDLGVTFNPQDETGKGSRPWELDAVPMLFPEAEWRQLEQALDQRARMFEMLLADLLGPQSLIRERVVPPELLYAHPSFQPAYHGLDTDSGARLTLFGADLARAPDGSWWVTGIHSRAPTGLGYVLENRIVMSRMLPAPFRQSRVKRLAPFFLELREALQKLAPSYRENPRIVLWTQGPTSPSYFEDAYLSRYLNFTLAEGADLAVRENRVMLKTLGGLLPVEVLWRRVAEDESDPVELTEDSSYGVAGLFETLRAGTVAVANAMGTRLVESPAWVPFLPTICRHLLSEELKLPSVATWWCGQPEAYHYVLEHLNDLVIRPAFGTGNEPPIIPGKLSRGAREELLAELAARPQRYVGHEYVRCSTTPVWSDGRVQPWHVALRCFLVAKEESFSMLPGALARASSSEENLENVLSTGQRSQDVWVLSDEPVKHVTLLNPPGKSVALRRSGAELPSRVADNLFWLGRHVERADGSARLLHTLFLRMAGAEENDAVELSFLLRLLAEFGQVEPGFFVEGMHESLPDLASVLPSTLFNEQEPQSLRSTINHIVGLASIVRDRLSIDAWRIIHHIDEGFRLPAGAQERCEAADVLELLSSLKVRLASFAGLASETMTRTLGWRFLELGRRIERSWYVATLLRGTVCRQHANEQSAFDAALEIADSKMTYRSRYLANLQVVPLVDLLLSDETNPRSVAYQFATMDAHLQHMPRSSHQVGLSAVERVALSLLNNVRLADVHELCQLNSSGTRPALERLLVRLLEQLPKLSEAISSRFLIHAGRARHYGAPHLGST